MIVVLGMLLSKFPAVLMSAVHESPMAQLYECAADRPLVYIKYCCSGRFCCAALRSKACLLLGQHVQYTLRSLSGLTTWCL